MIGSKNHNYEYGYKRDPVGALAKIKAAQKELTERYITGKN